jgi:hypothetical protein
MTKIDACKKEHYSIKLNIWESKNELMDLHGQLQHEEDEFYRLQAFFPQQEEEDESENEGESAALEILMPSSHEGGNKGDHA